MEPDDLVVDPLRDTRELQSRSVDASALQTLAVVGAAGTSQMQPHSSESTPTMSPRTYAMLTVKAGE